MDNRPGAAGYIGVETAARATHDGYTFLLGNVGTMAINQAVQISYKWGAGPTTIGLLSYEVPRIIFEILTIPRI